jgi:hypothetical protein
MANLALRQATLLQLVNSPKRQSLAEISRKINGGVPQRTLRRWLSGWVAEGVVQRSGAGRATCYQAIELSGDSRPSHTVSFVFLTGLDNDLKTGLMKQIRDLWTHTSTAIEGNTLSLGDTHFILEEGLTISGKPIKDHEEVLGHARAIDLLYHCLDEPLSEDVVFDLHKAVQTEHVVDINRPNGGWKVEPNGTFGIGPDGSQAFIEYAVPVDVPTFMAELIHTLNTIDSHEVKRGNAHKYYAKIHMGIAHIHPFGGGNGRIARLIANIPLLKAGLPPMVIPQQERRAYIQSLANYQIAIGRLSQGTGIWPDLSPLKEFTQFCASCYDSTRELVASAFEIHKARH